MSKSSFPRWVLVWGLLMVPVMALGQAIGPAASTPPNGVAGGDLSGSYPNPTVSKTGGVAFGTAATANTGTSGGNVPLLNTANTFSADTTISAANTVLTVASSTTTGTTIATMLNGSLNTSAFNQELIGVDTGANDAIVLQFSYVGAGSSSNLTKIGVNQGSLVSIDPSGNEIVPGVMTITGTTTGTNADFLCMSSGKVVLLQSTSCTISSKRFKIQHGPFADEMALRDVLALQPSRFRLKPRSVPDIDPNRQAEQVGLYAEDVAAVEPLAAIYDDDMKTPKSWRQEAVIALLVGAVKAQQAEIVQLQRQVARRQLGAK